MTHAEPDHPEKGETAKPSFWESLKQVDIFSVFLMLFETVFVLWLMIDKKHLSAFVARKLCHAGSGCIMMLINAEHLVCRLFIYSVVGVSLVMNSGLLPAFNCWFGAPRDVGITIYLCLVFVWVFLGQNLRIMAPMFLADPAGSVVGKWLSLHFPDQNYKWFAEKTIGGSSAVFLVTLVCLYRPRKPLPRIGVAALAALGEAVGGAYDNLVIGLIVIAFSEVV